MPVRRAEQDGVVLDRDDVLYLDTRARAWEPMPDISGAQRKVLTRDAAGNPLAFLLHLNPGFGPPEQLASRSVATAAEITVGLAGELSVWEYEHGDDQLGTLVRLRQGYAVHRQAGSLHGFGPGPRTPVGFTCLTLRLRAASRSAESAAAPGAAAAPPTGPGPAASTAGEERPGAGRAVILDRPGVRIVDSEAMEWADQGVYGRSKVIARDQLGKPLLTLQHVGPDFALPGHPVRHSHPNSEHNFVLWGEFPIAEYERGRTAGEHVLLKAGYFAHRRPGDIHGLVPGGGSATGCVSLQWYTDGAGDLTSGSGGTIDEF